MPFRLIPNFLVKTEDKQEAKKQNQKATKKENKNKKGK